MTASLNAPRPDRDTTPAIAIVGLSAYYPGSPDLATFWSNILARRRAFRRLPPQRLSPAYQDPDPLAPDQTYLQRAAVIDGFQFDWVARRVPKQVYESADLAHWLALEMAIRAVEDAGYSRESLPREGTGVLLGNTLTGDVSRAAGLRLRWPYVARTVRAGARALGYGDTAVDALLTVTEDVYKSAFPEVTEHTLPGVIPNTIAGRICNYFDVKGGGYVVDGACASSLIALADAANALVDHRLDLALAGGVDLSIDPFETVGFAKIGALSRDEMYVYEQRSRGFLPGEGCGWVVLKRLEDARRDGDYVYAVLRGWGVSSDGKGGLTAPSIEGQQLAIERAYAHAGYGPGDLDFVEGHGTGTAVGDLTELSALARTVASVGPEHTVGLTALKSIIGHCKAAAGVGSLIKTVLAVNQRLIPPLAGCERPHAVFADAPLYPLLEGQVADPATTVRAGVSAFGFGGINAHATVESADPPRAGLAPALEPRALFASPQDSELFVFRAPSAEALRARIEPLVEDARGLSAAELTDLAAHLASSFDAGAFSAAIVAATPEELAERLETALHLLDAPPADGQVLSDTTRGVWLGQRTMDCKVAFVYPGQGSQQVNMGRSLVERWPWARELSQAADSAVGDLDGERLSDLVYRPLYPPSAADAAAWRKRLTSTEVCQPAITLTEVLYSRYLRELGIQPVAVGGHSLGELSAFWAAGAVSDHELFDLARLRGACMAAPEQDAGTMASLACSREDAERLCAESGGYVVVANVNSDRQVAIAGDVAAVDRALQVAAERGISGQRLAVSNAFHSRYVQAGADRLAERASLPDSVPALTTRLYSSLAGQTVETGASLRAHFARQMVQPVDFPSLAAALTAEADVLLEVGPGKVLSGLVANMAATRATPCLPVEAEAGSSRALNQALAAVFAYGGQLNLAVHFARRLHRPYVSPRERSFIESPCERPLQVPPIPAAIERASTGTSQFEATLAEHTGYAADVVGTYLQERGAFLAGVVRADLATRNAEPRPAHALVQPPRAAETPEPDPPEPAPVATDGRAIEDVLIDLVVERTGFPRDAVRPDMTLLNDLNIESIGAGEIVARAALHAGVSGQLDPSQLLQASIQQVADQIRAASGAPAPSVVQPEGDQSKLLDTLERLSGQATWVRSFAVEYRPAPASEQNAPERLPDGATVLVLADPDSQPRAEAIASEFARRGAGTGTRVASFTDLASTPGAEPPDVVVAVLPPADPTQPAADAVRAWMDRLLVAAAQAATGRTRLTYVQFGGGYFGTRPDLLQGPPLSASAFVASLHHERPSLHVRVVDVPASLDPATLARLTADETLAPDVFVRAGFDEDGVRRVPWPRVVQPAQSTPRNIDWTPADVILVTGGGRGITAELALAVGARTGAQLVLTGRSPIPTDDDASSEVAATLRRAHEAGLRCAYLRCDVTDPASVAHLVAEIEQRFGPVTGVLHGAGINMPALVGQQSTDQAFATVAPKLLGLRHVLDALEAHPLKLVAGLSSIIGVTGMPGNSWYGLSNEGLDRWLEWYGQQHPRTAVVSVAYSLWDGAGMGVKLGGVADQIRRMGTSALPPAVAIERFLAHLECDFGHPHLVVAGRLNGLDTWCPDQGSDAPGRYLEDVASVQPGVELVARAHLSLERDNYLLDHVYKGSYLWPMVFGLEAMAQAAAAVLGCTSLPAVRIEDIDLPRPIVVDPVAGQDVLIQAEVLEATEPEPREQRVAVRIACRSTDFAVDHFSAVFVLPNQPTQAPLQPVALPPWPLEIDPERDLYGRFLFHGPRFRRLQRFYRLRSDYCVFQAEQRDSDYGDLVLGDPYFRDALMQAGQVVISQERGLPRHIRALEIFPSDAPPGVSQPIVEGVLNERTSDMVDCTITVVGEGGRVLQRLVNCQFSILEHRDDEPTAEDIAAPDERDQALVGERLATTATALRVRMPAVVVANLPGLHDLAPGERQAREAVVLEQAVDGWRARRAADTSQERAGRNPRRLVRPFARKER